MPVASQSQPSQSQPSQSQPSQSQPSQSHYYDDSEAKAVFVDTTQYSNIRVTLHDLYEIVNATPLRPRTRHLEPRAAKAVFDHLPIRGRVDTVYLKYTFLHINRIEPTPTPDLVAFARFADDVICELLYRWPPFQEHQAKLSDGRLPSMYDRCQSARMAPFSRVNGRCRNCLLQQCDWPCLAAQDITSEEALDLFWNVSWKNFDRPRHLEKVDKVRCILRGSSDCAGGGLGKDGRRWLSTDDSRSACRRALERALGCDLHVSFDNVEDWG